MFFNIALFQPPKPNRPGFEGIWIGLSDRATKKRFVWEDTSLLPTYSNWNAGEPNNTPHKGADNVIGEDCSQIVPAWIGKWNDYPCVPAEGFDKQNTFCEYGKFLLTACMHFLLIQFIGKHNEIS